MRKEIRLQKARQRVLTYNGTPKHMAKNYRTLHSKEKSRV